MFRIRNENARVYSKKSLGFQTDLRTEVEIFPNRIRKIFQHSQGVSELLVDRVLVNTTLRKKPNMFACFVSILHEKVVAFVKQKQLTLFFLLQWKIKKYF